MPRWYSRDVREYRGVVADSRRWCRFETRPDDVIISTPSKCGTTWMQHLVGMLLLDRVEFGQPLSDVSPWLDGLFVGDEVLEALAGQRHRRFIKTHTPHDGLPWSATMTYISVFRHPFDAALSMRDHDENTNREYLGGRLTEVSGSAPPSSRPRPTDPAEYLKFWIEDEEEPDGAGPRNLADYANSLRVAWELRSEPNVHLFHYDDLRNDLDGQVVRLAGVLGVDPAPDRRAEFVAAATLDAMRDRARDTAPYGEQDHWLEPKLFFRSGGRRDWGSLLTRDDIERAEERLVSLVGEAPAAWACSAAT